MKTIQEFKSADPLKILEEKESSGCVICSCGKEFSYSLREQLNMGDYMGFVVPICPECQTVPNSETRRMDL